MTMRDPASVVDRGVVPEERSEQSNPAWVQDNVVPDQEAQHTNEIKRPVVNVRHRPTEASVVEPPSGPVPGPYIVRLPNPPLDDTTNQRREKVKEVCKQYSKFITTKIRSYKLDHLPISR